MTGRTVRTLLSAALAGSMILAGTVGVEAYDNDRWDRDYRDHRRHVQSKHSKHDRSEHRHDVPDHRYHPVSRRYEAPPRVVYERQPVYVIPAPMYQAPAYPQPADPSLNFNFAVPLR